MPETPQNEEQLDVLTSILMKLRLRAGIFARPDFCGRWAVDTSGRKPITFHAVGSGTCWLHTHRGEPPRMLRAGDLVVFPFDDRHEIASSPEPPAEGLVNHPEAWAEDGPVTSMLCGYFQFESRGAVALLESLSPVIVMDLQNASRHRGTPLLLQLIVSELENKTAGVDVIMNHLAYILFVHVLRSEMGRVAERGLLAALSDPVVGEALALVHRDPGRNWSVEKLASAAGASRSSFAGRFKQLLGTTPIRYVTEWRMQEAEVLLETTDESIAMIAERCGYKSEVAFRKAFRATVGKPPGLVRRERRDRLRSPLG